MASFSLSRKQKAVASAGGILPLTLETYGLSNPLIAAEMPGRFLQTKLE